ncbi:MAG: methyltransferase domain-containing protein [Candidatus Aenigmarchaeota archaeon]|nr:methyltransferase domain-containing protein [Candidatus Aenigmarchaeota archaeon]
MQKNEIRHFNVKEFPVDYQKYLQKEEDLIVNFLKPDDMVLDVGCGIGRLIPKVAPLVKSYVGVDINWSYLKDAKKIASKYKNARVLHFDANKLSKKFGKDVFDKVICAFNTMGCIPDGTAVIREISKVVSKSMMFSINSRGSLRKRIKYYKLLGIDYTVDEKTETIYSKEWESVRAYNKEEIKDLCKGSEFHVRKITPVLKIGYIVLLEKK